MWSIDMLFDPLCRNESRHRLSPGYRDEYILPLPPGEGRGEGGLRHHQPCLTLSLSRRARGQRTDLRKGRGGGGAIRPQILE
jgi:hypothetical protein